MRELSRRERFLFTFEKKKRDRLSFSPRLYYWYKRNKSFINPRIFQKKKPKLCQTEIPSFLMNKTQMEIYDLLDATPRYPIETNNIPLSSYIAVPNPILVRPIYIRKKNGESITKLNTKLGSVTQKVSAPGGGLSGHPVEYFVKSLDDLKIIKYIISHSHYYVFNPLIYYAKKIWKERGVVSLFVGRSPYQRCILDLLGFRKTILFLKKYPRKMEDFFAFLNSNDEQMFRKVGNSSIKIINFGENIDANLTPPHMFKKYCIPWYDQHVKELQRKGKYCHIHMDGAIKDLLPFLTIMPFDGYEALTPKPQGDATIDEIKEAIGEKILLDGIPSNIFLPQYSMEYIENFTQNVIEKFAPNLILGVSDELSPNGDINKIIRISEIIKKFEL